MHDDLDVLAKTIHSQQAKRYREQGKAEVNPAAEPWERLRENLKDSNRHQADHIAVKLRAIGCYSATAPSRDPVVEVFSDEEVELLARMEHARWNAERWLDGWTLGPRDHAAKTSPYLVGWDELSEDIKDYDRAPVRNIPTLLSLIGAKVYRRPAEQSPDAWVHDLLAMAERLKGSAPSRTCAATDPQQRVLIVAGGAAGMAPETLAGVRPLLDKALEAFSGRVISGGTSVGVPGCVAEVAASLAARGAKRFELLGYIPDRLPPDAPKDARYDKLVICGQEGFSPEQILGCWSDLLDAGVRPEDVILIGFGGGPVSAVEYRLALAFGATVAVVIGTVHRERHRKDGRT